VPKRKIAIAWELGDNHGHLGRHMAIADSLTAQGHDVLFIVRNTTIARETLGERGHRFIQAPIFQSRAPGVAETVNYASILLASGYRRQQDFSGLLAAWLDSFRLCKPDLVIVDHAPTALLAARLQQRRVLTVGTGFELPPPVDPFPSLQPWKNISIDRLNLDQAEALATVNAHLVERKHPALTKLSSIFAGVSRLATTIPELDPYGARARLQYIGAVQSAAGHGERIEWQNTVGAKIFVYLHNAFDELVPIVGALKTVAGEAVCVFPGIDPARFADVPSHVRLFDRLVDMSKLLPDASICVSNGGHGLAMQCIEDKLPMMLIPTYLEQFLTAHRVQAMKGGIILPPSLSAEQYAQALTKIVQLGRSFMAKEVRTENGGGGNAIYLKTVERLLSS